MLNRYFLWLSFFVGWCFALQGQNDYPTGTVHSSLFSVLNTFDSQRVSGTGAQRNEYPHRISGKSLSELKSERGAAVNLILPSPTPLLLPPGLPSGEQLPPPASLLLDPGTMPSAYSFQMLGVFCKFEVQLEKAARFPVKFRLGEVQYTEGLEGKDRWGEPFRVTEKPRN